MQAGPGFQFGGYVGRCELSPALMVVTVGLKRVEVSYLLGLRTQGMVYRWKRNR
jgi:hypothetical protein